MKYLVISDLHLDKKNDLGFFHWSESGFIERVERAIADYSIDRVILLGDIFELYRYFKSEVYESYPLLLSFFNRINAVFVRGNHDSVSHTGRDAYHVMDGGHSILFIHGHQADFWSGNPVIMFIIKWFMKGFRLLTYIKPIRSIYIGIYRAVDRKPVDFRSRNEFPYLFYALRLLESGHDMVVMGHTHKQDELVVTSRGRKKIYINTGTCSLGRFEALVLNTETMDYTLIKEDAVNLPENLTARHDKSSKKKKRKSGARIKEKKNHLAALYRKSIKGTASGGNKDE